MSDENSARVDTDPLDLARIHEMLAHLPDATWEQTWYSAVQRFDWGLRVIAEVLPVENDDEHATVRYWTAEFIARSREWVPALVAELEAERGRTAKLKTALFELVDTPSYGDAFRDAISHARYLLESVVPGREV